MAEPAVEYVRQELDNSWKHFKRGQQLWSFAHHGSLYGGAVLAFVTTALVLVEAGRLWEGIAAASATLLSTIASIGGFARKWRSARLCRGRIENLRWDLNRGNADTAKLLDKLKAINEEHDKVVIGPTSGGA